MPRYKLIVEYDGTDFSGWQIQPNAITVEQVLEDAFSQILQQKIDLIGQGRTDAGVHAIGQTAHVDLPDAINTEKLIFGVNGIVGEKVFISKIEQVDEGFHARFDALSRQYVYTITTRPKPLARNYTWSINHEIDSSKLLECAEMLIGEFDFAGFSKFNEDNFTTLCEIQKSFVEIDDDIIRYRIRANRFLRNMVRRLIGTMIRVAEGKLSITNFRELLVDPAKKIHTFTAPAKGLVLEKVLYKI